MGQPDTMTISHEGGAAQLHLPRVTVRARTPGKPPVEATLGLAPVLVGSSPECDVCVDDPGVSRQHCELRQTARGIVIRDLGSKNGTHVKGVRVVEAHLPPQVEVTLGRTNLVVFVGGQPAEIPLAAGDRFGAAFGASVAMRALFARLERAAVTDEPVVLLGESGTGKELLARGVHDASARRAGPFVVVDCGAIAPSLIEAELFGHAKGAFTGATHARSGLIEQAHGGTLFLDEIGELPLDLQTKLLRALESKQVRPVGGDRYQAVDARVVAATHRDLKAKVATGAFRADLYYRLAVVVVDVPPLRDRKEDIPLLVARFLAERTPPLSPDALPPNALALLEAHDWPGNVRELRNTVARLVLFPELGAKVLDASPSSPADAEAALLRLPLRQARGTVVAAFERRYLAAQLAAADGNVTAAAQAIGVSRQMLHRMLAEHGLRGRASDEP